MTCHHPEIPRRGPHRERLRRAPSAVIDPALPILRELEILVRQAAEGRPSHDPGTGTTTVPSRSVRLSGTPASRTADAVDGAGCP
jgi:hypothetical protein